MEGVWLDGRYLVESKIASGGTATVYRGLDARLDRPVALKVMDFRYAEDPQFLTRFQMEARSVARLKNPGLVAVYDQGRDGDHAFLVMELVEGGTLRELLTERGPMPPHAVVAALRPLLGGLAAAHRVGLVHRDVKPENVLISDEGEVKIADFGLVRAVAEAGITSRSVILGTAAYLSPEQVRDGTADSRSDVYAAGILTFELLTGSIPFTGDTSLSIAYQRLEVDVPAPSTVIDGIPEEFDDLVVRATHRDPALRYPDALAMAEEVDRLAAELGLPAFRLPAPRESALHHTLSARSVVPAAPAPTSATRRLPREPQRTPLTEPASEPTQGSLDADSHDVGNDEFDSDEAEFAGIALSDFRWQRQRSRRAVLIWLAIVLAFTGLAASAAWTLGNNLSALL